MKINPISAIKPLTGSACCVKVDITVGITTVMFGKHKFEVRVVHCKNCGQVKATSYIKEKK